MRRGLDPGRGALFHFSRARPHAGVRWALPFTRLAPSLSPRSSPHTTFMGNIPSGALAKAAPIHEAAAMDNVPKLRQLLAEGEDVNAVDKVSSTNDGPR